MRSWIVKKRRKKLLLKSLLVFAFLSLNYTEIAEKMCREYSTQEVTVNDETDKDTEYEKILVIPLRAPKIRWTP